MNTRGIFSIVVATGMVLAIGGAANADLLLDLEACWAFDNDYTDISINGYGGTVDAVPGVSSSNSDSILGWCSLSFDGTDTAYVDINAFVTQMGDSAASTFLAWVRTTQSGAVIMGKTEGDGIWSRALSGQEVSDLYNTGSDLVIVPTLDDTLRWDGHTGNWSESHWLKSDRLGPPTYSITADIRTVAGADGVEYRSRRRIAHQSLVQL